MGHLLVENVLERLSRPGVLGPIVYQWDEDRDIAALQHALREKIRSYEGGDRAPSPPAYLLEADLALADLAFAATGRKDFSSSQKAHSGPNRE